ncbi:carotenoid oxygenase family protein [Nonomuraea basaltis]|uniref:carotenoid oxygenase family protein n=1 Tax=Nonomuraea basaltis TaxID=2495887 RepID=UPI00110C63DA|nr:carotenoid oxygenase family protein [Nonomuraea basaltis]TMR90622.1 carotenoid oxygenase family protein [Nonomuraea basaltis]
MSADRGPTSAANTNLINHRGRILALNEACLPTAITPELDTGGRYDFALTADHRDDRAPQGRPGTGKTVLLRRGHHRSALAALPRRRRAGRRVHSEDIEVRGSSMMRDFTVTQNHMSLC